MIRVVSALVLALFTIGCSTPGAVSTDFRFSPNADTGVAVGSITYDATSGIFSLVAVPRQAEGSFSMEVGQSWAPAWYSPLDKDLGSNGGTFVRELPAGDYVLRAWSIRNDFRLIFSVPFVIPFSVAKGSVTYLGNLHVRNTATVGPVDATGRGRTHSADAFLLDEAVRDLPVLRSRYPGLAQAPVAVRVREGLRVNFLGSEKAPLTERDIYVPATAPQK